MRSIKLELLRTGPSHNQLLSPLTPYIALCGAAAPQTVHMPWEQRQLMNRLARLRYAMGTQEIPASQREAELREVGEAIGRVLADIRALPVALKAVTDDAPLVHLRLSSTALELAMVPFEAVISADHFPGAGSPLLLRTPTVLTREVRRDDPIPVEWNRAPRLLFAFANPPGVDPVPAQAHLVALRRALAPYVKRGRTAADAEGQREQRLKAIAEHLTVLPDATLADIEQACREQAFTHVHLLAHGVPFDEAGTPRYGLALNAPAASGQGLQVVDGERLALALRGASCNGTSRRMPTVVSLATCDSGAVDSVLAPGGSIAHDLHAHGVPWVVASQFPLWMSASVLAAQILYEGLLRGDDPRCVLHDLRRRLRMEKPETHDWASIVAYAEHRWDLDEQVAAFRERQFKARLEVRFARMDDLVADGGCKSEDMAELKQLSETIRAEHEAWLSELDESASRAVRSERLGSYGASEKRIGVIRSLANDADGARQAYRQSIQRYQQALAADPRSSWALTQFLGMQCVSADSHEALDKLRSEFGSWWIAARQIADWQRQSPLSEDRTWALSSLAELELLGIVYDSAGSDETIAERKRRIETLCRQLVDVSGRDGFPARSTERQFRRYLRHWHGAGWEDLALAALAGLGVEPGGT